MAMAAVTFFKIREGVANPDEIIPTRSSLAHFNVKLGKTRIGDLYVKRVERSRPGWLRFFDNAVDLSGTNLKTASLAAVLLVKQNDSLYAVVFGYGISLLSEEVLVRNFGLKATLNAVEPSQLRSIDHKRLEAVSRHTREQLTRGGTLDQFGLDIDRDLLRAVTGTPAEAKYGRRLSGADQLTVLADISLANLAERLEAYKQLAEEMTYVKNFPWVDQIRGIREPDVRRALDKRLLKELQSPNSSFWLAPPEIIDWGLTDGFRYSTRKSAIVYDELLLAQYFEEYGAPKDMSETDLAQHRIYHVQSDDPARQHGWQFIRCLVGELEWKGTRYILNEGQWYEIQSDFLQTVEDSIAKIPIAQFELPPYADKNEGAYNKRVAKKNKEYFALLDQNFIQYPQRGKVEVCDLFTKDRKFVHVKRCGASSTLSHLFSQGTVSAQLMLREPGFRHQFQTKIPTTYCWGAPEDPISANSFEVCYAIVNRPQQEFKLPFFSKISLRSAVQNLEQLGFKVSLKPISS
jgi:uncharacterized protein (TIGR04141 family)